MELIRKSDAIHAVLHNTGDAAVAAVQNIKPINPHGELREMLIDEMMGTGKWRIDRIINDLKRCYDAVHGEYKDDQHAFRFGYLDECVKMCLVLAGKEQTDETD